MLRLINIGLLLSFSICYLEWPNNSDYIFQLQFAVFTTNDLVGVFTHPVIITPLIGEILILISLFKPKADKRLTFIGMILLGLIVLLFLLIGLMGLNWRMIISTIPFLLIATYFLYRRKSL